MFRGALFFSAPFRCRSAPQAIVADGALRGQDLERDNSLALAPTGRKNGPNVVRGLIQSACGPNTEARTFRRTNRRIEEFRGVAQIVQQNETCLGVVEDLVATVIVPSGWKSSGKTS